MNKIKLVVCAVLLLCVGGCAVAQPTATTSAPPAAQPPADPKPAATTADSKAAPAVWTAEDSAKAAALAQARYTHVKGSGETIISLMQADVKTSPVAKAWSCEATTQFVASLVRREAGVEKTRVAGSEALPLRVAAMSASAAQTEAAVADVVAVEHTLHRMENPSFWDYICFWR